MIFRKYLSVVIIISLLVWGPIDHSLSGWLIIRIGYLIIIPTIIWLLIGWLWNRLQLSTKLDNILVRILSGINCVVLLIMAIFEVQSENHIENTRWIQTRDGMEAVGADIIGKGPDWVMVFIIIVIAFFMFWFGVLKKNFHSSNNLK